MELTEITGEGHGREHTAGVTPIKRQPIDTSPEHLSDLLACPSRTTVNGYELGEKIGEGGFGEVFRASVIADGSVTDDASVIADGKVIKRLKRKLKPDELERLRQTYERVKLVGDDCAVQAEVIQRDNITYLLMDYAGEPIKVTDRNPEKVLDLFTRMAEAVGAIHNKDIVHGDLKPTNFLRSKDGHIRVTDFDLSDLLGGHCEVSLPTTAFNAGTYVFAAPEQISSEGTTADKRTDVYQLGKILFNMLTGELPGTDWTDCMVSRFRDSAPSLIGIISKATKTDPAQRYQACDELLGAIHKLRTEGQVVQSELSSTFGIPARLRGATENKVVQRQISTPTGYLKRIVFSGESRLFKRPLTVEEVISNIGFAVYFLNRKFYRFGRRDDDLVLNNFSVRLLGGNETTDFASLKSDKHRQVAEGLFVFQAKDARLNVEYANNGFNVALDMRPRLLSFYRDSRECHYRPSEILFNHEDINKLSSGLRWVFDSWHTRKLQKLGITFEAASELFDPKAVRIYSHLVYPRIFKGGNILTEIGQEDPQGGRINRLLYDPKKNEIVGATLEGGTLVGRWVQYMPPDNSGSQQLAARELVSALPELMCVGRDTFRIGYVSGRWIQRIAPGQSYYATMAGLSVTPEGEVAQVDWRVGHSYTIHTGKIPPTGKFDISGDETFF